MGDVRFDRDAPVGDEPGGHLAGIGVRSEGDRPRHVDWVDPVDHLSTVRARIEGHLLGEDPDLYDGAVPSSHPERLREGIVPLGSVRLASPDSLEDDVRSDRIGFGFDPFDD